jgi:hypothetical protein
VTGLHIPEYTPHVCVPTQDAYDAACRALDHYRQTLVEIRDLAFRGVGSPTDALEAIQQRASRALSKEN